MGLYDQCDYYYDICIIGLVKAANMFDPGKGYTFSTLATTCIKTEVLNDIRRSKSNKCKANFGAIPLDSPVYSDENGRDVLLLDTIPSDFDVEEHLIKKENIKRLKEAYFTLNEKEQRIIKYCFGSDKMSQKDIAKIYRTTQSAISRKLHKILEKLRERMNIGRDDIW